MLGSQAPPEHKQHLLHRNDNARPGSPAGREWMMCMCTIAICIRIHSRYLHTHALAPQCPVFCLVSINTLTCKLANSNDIPVSILMQVSYELHVEQQPSDVFTEPEVNVSSTGAIPLNRTGRRTRPIVCRC